MQCKCIDKYILYISILANIMFKILLQMFSDRFLTNTSQ